MPILPPITDLNTFADKTSGGNPAVVTDVGRAVDLNALKARVAENRTQANIAVAPPVITITDADSPFTLLPSHAGHVIRVDDEAAGPLTILVSENLYDAANARGFHVAIEIISAFNGGVVLTPVGSQTIAGGTPSYPIIFQTLSFLYVTSPTRSIVHSDAAFFAGIVQLVTDVGNAASAAAAAQETADRAISPTVITVTDAESPFTLLPEHAGHIIRVDDTNDAVSINVPSTLYDLANTRAFRVTFEYVSGGGQGIFISGSGGLVVEGGFPDGASVDLNGLYELTVTSPTEARVQLETRYLDALAPFVHPTHTAATRTIAVGDAGDIIPVSSANNAVAITVPHTLFGSLEAGRAFTFEGRVENLTNPITLAGSGGLVLSYYGSKSTLTAVGDSFVVVVRSATVADVYIAERRP